MMRHWDKFRGQSVRVFLHLLRLAEEPSIHKRRRFVCTLVEGQFLRLGIPEPLMIPLMDFQEIRPCVTRREPVLISSPEFSSPEGARCQL